MRTLSMFAALVLLVGASESQAQKLSSADVFISAESAIELIGSPGVTFLHVGTDETAFDEGHLQDAQFIPLSSIIVTRDGLPAELPPVEELTALFQSAGVDGNGRVIIYSDIARGDMDALAAARTYLTLDVLGHPNVAIVDGGLPALLEAGAMLSTEATILQTTDLNFDPQINERIIDADYVYAHTSYIMLADNRPFAQYSGEEAGDGVDRPGHIPTAANLYWKDMLDETGRLKPVESIARMWTDSGHEPGTEVVTYCRVGMQASYGYAIAKHLGLDVKLYDGSYIDWSNYTDYPVEVGSD